MTIHTAPFFTQWYYPFSLHLLFYPLILKPTVRALKRASAMDLQPTVYLYSCMQWLLDKILSPTPPPPNATLGKPRIAIIGAGLTGVSAASHCVGRKSSPRVHPMLLKQIWFRNLPSGCRRYIRVHSAIILSQMKMTDYVTGQMASMSPSSRPAMRTVWAGSGA